MVQYARQVSKKVAEKVIEIQKENCLTEYGISNLSYELGQKEYDTMSSIIDNAPQPDIDKIINEILNYK